MSQLSRRDFVGASLAGAGALLAGGLTGAAAAAAPTWPTSPTALVPLGQSGVKVSFVGLGTGVHGWNRSSNATRGGQEKFTRLVRYALDHGVTFMDVADLYGTHPMLKIALAGVPRDKYQIQSKIWWDKGGVPQPTTNATEAVERFLLELGTDHLDTVLLHCTSSATWPGDLERHRDELDKCKQRGLIRAHGTSCHSFKALQASLNSPWVDVQLARANHKRVIMDESPDTIATHLGQMRQAGKGVVGMKIFGEGKLRTPEEREASLKWHAEHKCVDAMVIGFEKPEHIDETMGMLERVLKG